MAHQIIKQPDGKLAVFDASASLIVLWDATEEETVDWFARRAAERERPRRLGMSPPETRTRSTSSSR